MKPSIPFGRALGAILLLDAACLLPILSSTPLSHIDEGQIAEVAREMVWSGDWLTPRIGGVPFPAYPPLAYWVFAASGSIFGFNEFAMRLPTLAAALALVALLAALVRRISGPEEGLLSAAILVTLPAFQFQSTVCRADVLTMLLATAAFDRFIAWAEGARRSRDLALLYVFGALGILCKGPLAVAVLGLGGLAWFILRGEWKLLLPMKPWIGIPALLLIVLPWYLAMAKINGREFIRANVFLENVSAFVQGFEQKRPWYFYFRQIHLLMPWVLLLAASGKFRRHPGLALSLTWFVLVFCLLTISSAKRINYLTYVCPPLAMAAGTTLAALWTHAPRAARMAFAGIGGIAACGGIGVAVLPASVWSGEGWIKLAPHLTAAGSGAAAVALAIVTLALWKGARAAFLGTAALMAVASFLYFAIAAPKLSPDFAIAEFCRKASVRVPPEEPIYVPAPEGATGIYHFYMRAPMPLRDGSPGCYLALESQRESFSQSGKRMEIVESMLDQRGQPRYLLRILP